MPQGRTSQHLQRLVELKERSGEPEAALKVAIEWKTLSPGAVQPWLTEAALLTELNRDTGVAILMATHSDETAAAARRTLHMRDGVIDGVRELV